MAKPPPGVQFTVKIDQFKRVLTPKAVAFVAQLQRAFGAERQRLLALRAERQKLFDRGSLPDFLPATAAIRAAEWKIASIPADLQDRRVEITGPTDRKMVINALNSGARVFMADFEDSNVAHLGQYGPRTDQSHGPLDQRHRAYRSRHGQALCAGPQARRADGETPRAASR